MNSIRQIQELNRRELENNVHVLPFPLPHKELITCRPPNASWHADYRDTAYVYIGGLPFELSEGDIITIFSQYGEPTYINLIRDKETGKSKGFAFLKYEDQRSTDLAVDNLGGSVIMGRTLKVDHTRYKRKEGEEEQGIDLEGAWKHTEDGDGDEDGRRKRRRTSVSESEDERPMLKEERELAKLIQDHDEDDPMKTFLVEEKKEEVVMALGRLKEGKSEKRTKSHRHKHHHRSRRDKDERNEDRDARRSRHQKESDDRQRRRSRSQDDARERNRKSRHSEQDGSEDRKKRRRSPRAISRERDRYRGHER
jgi:RNA-binding motif X-linked protein 2